MSAKIRGTVGACTRHGLSLMKSYVGSEALPTSMKEESKEKESPRA